MSDAYRDETGSLQAKVARLEEALKERDRELEELRRRASDQDAVFAKLKTALDDRPARRSGRGVLVACALIAAGTAAGGIALARARAASPAPRPESQASPAPPPTPAGDPCARLGVHLTLGGEDAEAPASGARDLAGHKYRRGGDRSPWFTVNGGPLYVHGVGDFLPADTGTTRLSLLTVMTKGETGGYTLARDGRSLLEVQGSDGKRVWGRFEADVSKVDDTTRTPPFGTPVTRLRGSFCLPALPANPSDTGP